MELKKVSESINRFFNEQGEGVDRVESASYNIIDGSGNTVGSANIGNGYGSANINLNGFPSIAEGEEKLKEMLGI